MSLYYYFIVLQEFPLLRVTKRCSPGWKQQFEEKKKKTLRLSRAAAHTGGLLWLLLFIFPFRRPVPKHRQLGAVSQWRVEPFLAQLRSVTPAQPTASSAPPLLNPGGKSKVCAAFPCHPQPPTPFYSFLGSSHSGYIQVSFLFAPVEGTSILEARCFQLTVANPSRLGG